MPIQVPPDNLSSGIKTFLSLMILVTTLFADNCLAGCSSLLCVTTSLSSLVLYMVRQHILQISLIMVMRHFFCNVTFVSGSRICHPKICRYFYMTKFVSQCNRYYCIMMNTMFYKINQLSAYRTL